MTARYILQLKGAIASNATNNSIIEITPSVASNNTSKIEIDLSTLGEFGLGSIASCEFDVYSELDGALHPRFPDGKTTVCQKDNSSDGTGNQWDTSFRDGFLHHLNQDNGLIIQVNDVSTTYKTDNGNYCHFVVQNHRCEDLFFDRFSSTGTLAFIDKNNSLVRSGTTAITTESFPISTQGITFTCGSSNTKLNFDYTNFNVEFQNNCSNSNESYLIFTPSATGSAELGGLYNSNGSVNDGFSVSNYNNQDGDFYLNIFCKVDQNGLSYLRTDLENVLFG